MLGMLMAAGEASNQVPFWLQVTSIALAPILGFLGVSVGVMMKDRSDRRNALRSDRLATYMELLAALADLRHLHYRHLGGAARQHGPSIELFAKGLEDIQSRLLAGMARVDLIGSTATATALTRVEDCLAMYVLIYERVSKETVPLVELHETLSYLDFTVRKFRDAAMADLNIPKTDRRRDSGELIDPDSHPAAARLNESYQETIRELEAPSEIRDDGGTSGSANS